MPSSIPPRESPQCLSDSPAHCGKPLAIGTRKAGQPITCPSCHGDMTVPAAPPPDEPPPASDAAPAADNAVPWYVEAQALLAAESSAPAPTPAEPPRIGVLVEDGVRTGPPPTAAAPSLRSLLSAVKFRSPSPHVLAAVGLPALLLALGGVALIVAGLLSQEPEPSPDQPAQPPAAPRQTAQVRETRIPAPAAPRKSLTAAVPATDADKKTPAPPQPPVKQPAPEVVERPAAEKPESPTKEAVQEQPKPRAEVVQELPQKPATPPFQVKRRTQSTDEDLRKQLLFAPVVALDAVPKTTQQLITAAKQPGNQGKDLVPMLAMQRADLYGLPLRMGHECHTGKEPAEHLQALSRKLRTHIEAAIPPAQNGVVTDPRPDPEILRQRLLGDAERRAWLQPEAIPALQQLLMAENKAVRLVLVDVLAQIKGRDATRALAMRALVDLHPDVRAAALRALRERRREDFADLFVAGFRYPWPAVADHAAEGVVALELHDLVPRLIALLDLPDPAAPFKMTMPNKKTVVVTRELVRINHLSNCLLCHAPSFDRGDLVRGLVPTPGEALPAPVSTPRYYEGDRGNFARADITYLKQDFSVCQPVPNHGPWPGHQRFDYLIRFRPASAQEFAAYQLKARDARPIYRQKDAVLYTLRELTGQDRGMTTAAWLKDSLLKFSNLPSPAEQARKLSAALVKASAEKQHELLTLYMVSEDAVYNLALAQAIPRLPAAAQKKGREALTERLIRSPEEVLREHLRAADPEIRLAAVVASGRAEAKALVPDLIDCLATTTDKEVTWKVRQALERVTGQDFGPPSTATLAERAAAVAEWRAWWAKQAAK